MAKWTEDEQIIVLYYYLIKGAKGSKENKHVQKMADVISTHSINSIAMKIGNYVHLNPEEEGGLVHTSELDRKIWDKYSGNLGELELKGKEFLVKIGNQKEDEGTFCMDPTGSESESLPEGSKTKIFVNRYERNPGARRKCIDYYGANCQICGFDFGEVYGEIGAGFIEVHHKIPISEIGVNYEVNPLDDLVPVCSNCHSMIHRKRNQTVEIEEMKNMLKL
ncbi:HNH endonuclease [Methanolobus sp. ZRKC3]|uniref:HNH endonuclease n=1 Tax=Methanolobus sp. ZRKC3 TaxID=3125786 RepID=UPI0032567138